MKNHDEIRKLLPAYCGNDLEPEKKELVANHLRSCAECRTELSELELALRLLRTTPRVEPPPWMTARIMANLPEPEPEKKNWLQRLFFPLRIKVPLEIMALAVICVSSYYLSKTVETGLQQQPPEEQVQSAPISVPPLQPQSEQKQSQRKGATARNNGSAFHPETSPDKDTPTSPRQLANRDPSLTPSLTPPSAQKQETGGSVYQPVPARKRTTSSPFLEAQTAAPASSHERSLSPDFTMKLNSARSPENRERESARAVHPFHLMLRLDPDDPSSAAETITQAIISTGGALLEKKSTPPRRLKARIPAERLPNLIERLERLGKLAEQPSLPEPAGLVEVDINW